jgi:hypothetical protein
MQANPQKRKTAASEETTVSHSMVGMTGFEPAASASRTQRSTKLSHIPKCCLRQQTIYYHNGFAWQALFYEKRKLLCRDAGAPRAKMQVLLAGAPHTSLFT